MTSDNYTNNRLNYNSAESAKSLLHVEKLFSTRRKNISYAYAQNILSKELFRTLLVMLLMVTGAAGVWAQEDLSGTYYIGSYGKNADASNKYYLCPTEGWYYYKKTNSWEETDNNQPFLTTYKCLSTSGYDTSKAVWIIEKHETEAGCYYIKQKTTTPGVYKYIVSNGQISGTDNANRMRIHIEELDENSTALNGLGNMALFEIATYPPTTIGKETVTTNHLRIIPHDSNGRNGDNIYLVVNNGNFQNLKADGSKPNGPNGKYGRGTGGIISLYTFEQNAGWYLEDVIERPTISFTTDNKVQITGATGTTKIYYTTNGDRPTIGGSTTTEVEGATVSFDPADNVTTIKAIAIVNGEATNVTTFTPPVLLGSNHKRLIQSQANPWDTDFHFYMIPGDPSNDITKVNTTSLFRPTMEWYFESAGIEDGVQYYYIVNPTTSKNLCYDGTNEVYMETKTTTDNKFKFSIVESSTTGSFNISPYGENKKFINKGGNNNNATSDNLGLRTENTTYSNTASARWKFILPSTLDKKAPFTASDDTSTSYYKIENIGTTQGVTSGNFIVPPTGSSTYAEVTASSEASANWYFEVATPADNNDWLTYYYIRNAKTGDYLYFSGTGSNKNYRLEMRHERETGENAPKYQFTWARSASSSQYYIVPMLLKDRNLNQIASFQAANNATTLSVDQTRSAGSTTWKFNASPYNCATPTITFNGSQYVISKTESDAKIKYTLDNGTTWNVYTAPFDTPSSACTIKAYVYRSGDESDKSDEATFEVTQVATPAFDYSAGNSVIITCATEGVTIYYTTNGTEPSETNGTQYTQPLTDANVTANTTIKAIAVKAGSITSAIGTSTVTYGCAAPIIRRGIGKTFTLECTYPTTGVTIRYTLDGSEPTTSITSKVYENSAVSFDDWGITVKAIAIATGYSNSVVSEKTITEGLDMDGDVYLIHSAGDLEKFVTMVQDNENGEGASAHYRLMADVSGSGIYEITTPFTGTFEAAHDNDGNYYKITGLSHALFNTVDGGTVKNVMLDNVNVNVNGNAGAIANEARGAARIYNCGVLATGTGSTVISDENGYTKITASSSTISGSNYVGSIVGLLDGEARVINCFSFANITGGSYRGGIVGWNNVEGSNSTNLKTMVMNCMYYGNIDGGNKAPIYNGNIISNRSDQSGVSNFNYFWSGASYTNSIDVYNCALTAETRYLQRFEFFRHILNSNRELAAWWATGSLENKDEMLKWVMEPSQIGTTTPFPILKAPSKYYPSVVNIDAEHAESFTGDAEQQKAQRNQGRKFNTTFTINIQMGTSGDGYHPATGASITTSSVTRNITDKDPKHFNFNYYKVQLPYYNEVGSNNYRKDGSGVSRVVTGWKIVSMSKSAGSFTTGSDATATVDENGDISLTTPYNFADRNCTAKDIYSETNKRVFSQGAYFDVPEGVTSITIEPYWAQCVYVSDAYPDVVYDQGMSNANNVKTVGTVSEQARYTNGQSYSINGDNQVVYTSMGNAAGQMPTSGTVYDNAIVLVGNVHSTDVSNKSSDKAYTIMSIDLDKDNEPDYSYILRYNSRLRVHPVRVDFVNIPGLGMAQKSTGGTGTYNFGIMQPLGWFESTNTSLFRFTQFEYDFAGRANSPMILQGGVIEQWVTVGGKEQHLKEAKSVSYYHVGGNVWFKEFHIGVHQDKTQDEFVSPHPPISVTGGDFNELYLTGLYNTPNANYDDNAECYINGGRFGKVSGTGMQGIGAIGGNSKGNIIWQIDNADIDEFYAGGINAAHIAEGNITTVIKNSRVDQFCGGPKFGNMNNDKKVVTNATNCTFRAFFGAGYGGNSYNRRYPDNKNNINGNSGIGWDNWVQGQYTKKYDANYKGVETRIDYQFLPMSNNTQNVARLFVDYVSFSLATTYDVTSKLEGCTITTQPLGRLSISDDFKCLGNFYGGGSLGKVSGDVKSTLTNCTVEGSVFGAGYSATLPKVNVMNNAFQKIPYYDQNTGAYTEAILPTTEEYSWVHREAVNSTATAIDTGTKKLYTTENLNELGTVTGQVTLNIEGDNTAITGNVYGGGQSSDATSDVEVNVKAGSMVDVYGGGQGETTVVGGTVNVNIGAKANNGDLSGTGSISGSVYGGSALGAVNATSTKNAEGKVTAYTPSAGKTTNVNIYAGAVTGSVFGGGLGQLESGTQGQNGYKPAIAAQNFGNTIVTMEGGTVSTGLYGGANTNGDLKGNSTVTITGGTAGTLAQSGDPNNVVFGGGYGAPTLVEGNVEINLGAANQTTAGATINGSVYGGGALGNTNASWQPGANANDAPVLTPTANSTTAVNLYKGTVKGDVYGGGLGQKEVLAHGDIKYTEDEANAYNATLTGALTTSTELTADQATALNAVQGVSKTTYVAGESPTESDANKYNATLTGAVSTETTKIPAVAEADAVEGIPSTVGGNVTVELNNGVGDDAKGCIVEGAIFGCNNANGTPLGSVTVHIYGTQYAAGDNITQKHDPNPPYYTKGRKQGEGRKVYLQRLVDAATGVVDGGLITAANNAFETLIAASNTWASEHGGRSLMGREDGYLTYEEIAIINQYLNPSITAIENALDATKSWYDVQAVYGGGNEAEYKPTDKDGKTEVIIDGCDRTSIRYVYGGGNAAAVPATDVTVNSAKVIDYLFGGGNGERGEAWAADVGYDNSEYAGTALTKLIGGTIYHAFGGSNSNGDVKGGSNIEMPTPDPTKPKCTLTIKEIYGAGQNAQQSGGVKMILGCVSGMKEVYGGAQNANIDGGVTVVITSGTFEKVFGGNNLSGTIHGPIKVSIEETACDPIIIDELYLGGYQAPYSIFGYYKDGNNWKPRTSDTDEHAPLKTDGTAYPTEGDNVFKTYDNPVLDVISCTSIGKVFGGGLGETAIMYGSPTVNINMIKGAKAGENEEYKIPKAYESIPNITKTADVDANTIKVKVKDELGTIGDVYGGGSQAKVEGSTIVNIGASQKVTMESRNGMEATVEGANVIGNVYGGGQDAEVTGDTQVNICAHEVTTDNTTEWQSLSAISKNITIAGSVFGAGKGANTDVASAIVRGNSTIQMGGGWVKQNVYGGGELSCVGDFTFVTTEGATKDDIATYTAGGTSNVNIFAGKVGPETQTKPATYGHVYGAGKGDGSYPKFNYAQATDVTISGSAIVEGSVFGGSENGHVRGNTNVAINGGTIGVQSIKKGGATVGNVYGGGQGSTDHFDAGIVKGNTNVTISGGTIYHNIYGGGAYGSVGTITLGNATYVPGNASVANMPTAWDRTTNAETGKATITITGGTIGQDGDENGMIFGSSRGDVAVPTGSPAIDPNNYTAWVYDTEVTIGTEGSETGPTIFGSVYGSGENGHVFNDTDVKIHSGIVGVASGAKMTDSHDVEYDADDYPYRGNVYGGGCGEDKYDSNSDETPDMYNPLAGIVLHNTNIAITGGHVVHDVFGAGALGSVGNKSTINISGGRIGVDGDNDGNVYGAARGDLNSTQTDIAHVQETEVNIAYTTTPAVKADGTSNAKDYILGSVFGGGEAGIVKGSVAVNVSGGYIAQDVYGGGALANTNTDNWTGSALNADVYTQVTGLTEGTSYVRGLYTNDGENYTLITDKDKKAEANTNYYRYGTTYNTSVNLTGGLVGNVYGGGLGRLADTSNSISAVEAMVYGDVTITANGTAFTSLNDKYREYWYKENDTYIKKELSSDELVPKTGRLFGCNNLNGTPKGNVTVIVRRTKRLNDAGVIVNDHITNVFEIRGVYGGGNQANYLPATNKKTAVEVFDCDNTSIDKVYGGGNSASVPTTDVTIFGALQIHYVFGGGNGADVVWKNNRWQENDGANVTGDAHVVLKGGNISDAFIGSDTKGTIQNAAANVTTESGGDCNLKLTNFYGSSKRAPVYGDVDVKISACSQDDIENVYGGSYDAQIYGNITMTVTSGILKNVFGGNDRLGSIGGNITMNIEEADECKPIIIQNIYGGGFDAPYPGEGAKRITNEKDGSGHYTGTGVTYDENTGTYTGLTYADVTSGKITINIKSCTRIDNIFGGGLGEKATVTGETEINVNMIKGVWVNQPLPNLGNYPGSTPPNIHTAEMYARKDIAEGESVSGLYTRIGSIGSYVYTLTNHGTAQSGTTYYEKTTGYVINDAIGTIGNIFGGGDQGNIVGNATVNIGNKTKIDHLVYTDQTNEGTTENPKWVNNYTTQEFDVLGANITGDVYGGGNKADVTGNTFVNICAIKGAEKIINNEHAGYNYTASDITKYSEGVTIEGTKLKGVFGGGNKGTVNGNSYVCLGAGSVNQSLYGGGCEADVKGNTFVTMLGGYVFDGIAGGGLQGSVGTFTARDKTLTTDTNFDHSTHECIGKPTACKANTGTCTVDISGGQVGPVEVVTQGMRRKDSNDKGDPVAEGWVWGGGRGVVEDPSVDHDIHFKTYVNETDVTISGTALIMESVIGGGEFGRVLHNTNVTIAGGQIGASKVDTNNKPVRFAEADFIDPTTATASDIESAANNMPECSHFPYGRNIGTTEAPNWIYEPYDPYYDKYKNTFIENHSDYGPASTDNPSDGKTWIGCVFGGGSGYMPHDNGSGYDWIRSAGWVEGNANLTITGGHILTNVYGGNEYTDVGTPGVANTGKCTVKMSGGTIGVPRTLQQIKEHPVTCYLFGGGKGDERTHFDQFTNVNSVEVEVSGGIIYGSVFGGAEDGHVLGDAKVEIKPGAKIGTWGTSYVDGNVFGGGRGFSGGNLIAGGVGGNTTINITGGTMMGSIYGGGRLASVGIDLDEKQGSDSYGQLKDETGNQGDPTYGHITINISGGKIGTTTAANDGSHPVGGNVFGGSMGRITLLDGSTNPMWPKMAVAKLTEVNIYSSNNSTAEIMNNVYGGSEYGIVRNRTTVNVSAGTIHGHVFGGGYGSDEQKKTTITAGGYSTVSPNTYYTFSPMMWTGCVSGDTNVNISGGKVKKNVYGGGEFASVGLINFNSDKDGNYNYITKHENPDNGFALSWPYEFQYITGAPNDATSVGGKKLGGKATVTITGGRIGTDGDGNGYVFGGSKGKTEFDLYKTHTHNASEETCIINEQRYVEAFCANVRETEVKVNYASTPEEASVSSMLLANSTDPCIVGAVYGGGEDGHVEENTKVEISGGLIGYSVYGGGKGTGRYKGYLRDQSTGKWKLTAEDLYSWTAGKVYGNTEVIMHNGYVVRSVYGGGYNGSVGKGNYASGVDDYYPHGYGEKISSNLWTSASTGDNAWHFLNSGKTSVTIEKGTVGTPDGEYYGLPTGQVFGGARGLAAEDVTLSPRDEYAPDFFLGYVNESEVKIGDASDATKSPIIYGSVYGGGRDGHVRRDAHVIINNGTIGLDYNSANRTAVGVKDEDDNDVTLNHFKWKERGNVFGSGSGISTWNGTRHGKSSGSVTGKTTVDINGGKIYQSVYGGGAMASVGPPRIPTNDVLPPFAEKEVTQCVVNINGGEIGTATGIAANYGGSVYGASRGGDLATYTENNSQMQESADDFATTIWTKVNINPHPTDRTKDATIAGDVYGGGKAGRVKKDTEVHLDGGIITHDAYGGGQGTDAIAANVGGNATVELNKNVTSERGCVVNRIFGSNNLNGSPKGEVLVHVYATQNKNKGTVAAKYPKEGEGGGLEQGSQTDKEYLNTLIEYASQLGITVTSYSTIYGNATAEEEEEEVKTAIKDILADIAANKTRYDVEAVYGGGNLAAYVPNNPATTTNEAKVIIDGCELSSIYQVYGGGNAASTPATNLTINSAYEIFEAFGGGNGNDDYDLDGKHYLNPGANVGYYNFTHFVKEGTSPNEYYNPVENTTTEQGGDATTKEGREANYGYGTGVATTNVRGGTIHTVFGGSNKKGNIRKTAMSVYEASDDLCPLCVGETYGAGKEAPMDADIDLTLDCVKDMPIIYGGAKDADVNANITLNITNGTFEKVFGGNNTSGAITGSITVNVEERGCQPIFIKELYGGGYLAPYSIYGYEKDNNGNYTTETINGIPQRKPLTSGANPQKNPRINIISATRIDNIYGGGYQAKVVGSPRINVNMQEGTIMSKFASMYEGKPIGEAIQVAANDKTYTYTLKESTTTDASYNLAIGTIGNIFGGGNQADIVGDTHIEIGTGKWVNSDGIIETEDATGNKYTYAEEVTYTEEDCNTYNATLTGAIATTDNAYSFTSFADNSGTTQHGTGKVKQMEQADGWTTVLVTSNTPVDSNAPSFVGQQFKVHATALTANTYYQLYSTANEELPIYVTVETSSYTDTEVNTYNATLTGARSTNDVKTPGKWYNGNSEANRPVPSRNAAEITGIVYGGGNEGDVTSNTYITMENGSVENRIYGGGKIGSIGTYQNNNSGKPDTWTANTGVSNVTITGGMVGPAGSPKMDPNDETWDKGHVFGAGRGKDPSAEAGLDNLAYVYDTNVTIGGTAFVKGSVYGGSENGHVRHDTHVNIQEDCQIGCGMNTTKRHEEDNPDVWKSTYVPTEDNNLECFSWPYEEPFAPYDPNALSTGKYSNGSESYGMPTGSDGHTFYGGVFGGGSGYYPYKDANGKSQWVTKGGEVEGDTYVAVTGGHILTSLYGGNEMTNVLGNTYVVMTGGTLGVPRTLDQIKNHPVTCYLFGSGKGDQRTFFNTQTNIENAYVYVLNEAKIYGSVFGGGEDGHVHKNAEVNIGKELPTALKNKFSVLKDVDELPGTITKDGIDYPVIGTTGASYVDGNVFGAGRGFSGDALTAGSVGGNTIVNIDGGTMLGSIYGGGRLASVGIDFTAPNDPTYGQFHEDEKYTQAECDAYNTAHQNDVGFIEKTTDDINPDKTHGHVTVNISGGTIGNDVPNAKYGGNVYGGSMGRLEDLNELPNPLWPQLAQVKTTAVNISGNAHIKRSVYGGGELGIVRDDAIINISGKTTQGLVVMDESPTIEYNVFGGGYGSDINEDTYEATIHTGSGETAKTYTFRPIEFAGCVGGDTHVKISGGLVKRTVYGGGEMATVGLIDLDKTKSQKHDDETSSFALSWPYEYAFIQEQGGTANINITGGRIGLSGKDALTAGGEEEDNGDIYGGGKGIAGDRYDMSFCGNVRNSVVTIDVPTPTNDQIEIYDRTPTAEKRKWTLRLKELTSDDKIPGIAGSVYGGGEDGHVIENAVIKITNGYIGHSVYGGGKGKGTYKQAITDKDIPCNTAGKVYGNTTIKMTGGWIMRNIYGGGNLGSVGKGNYAGGTDDYYQGGYGEKTTGKLWEITKDSENKDIHDNAWHFLNSGIATVNVIGGTVGYMVSESDKEKISVCEKDDLPTGNVFGGCRGQAATEEYLPTYDQNPDFFLGYVNQTKVNIGGINETTGETTGPIIYGSVYGAGQDGHVRYQTNVTINKGEIGIPYNAAYKAIIGDNLDDMNWLNRGNVYGSGSGIGTYESRNKDVNDKPIELFSSSSGSTTRNTNVTVNSGIDGKTGGVIYRNVYGGGSMASVGPPLINMTEYATKEQSLCTVTIDGAVGTTDENIFVKEYGGEVYGASRGESLDPALYNNFADFASVIWTKVLVKKNAVIMGNVFGGGDAGVVKKDSEVIVGE